MSEPQPPEQVPAQPPWDDSLADSLAMIEAWAAVDAAEPGSEALRLAEAAMAVLLKHTGNPYAVALTMGKVLSQVREMWLQCPEECCVREGPARFREWFTAHARIDG